MSGVAKGPGQMALTVMPCGAHSRANVLVNCTMAPLLEEAAHQVVVEEWWKDLWLQARIVFVVLFLLFLLGGISLVTAAIEAESVRDAIKAVYARLKSIKFLDYEVILPLKNRLRNLRSELS